MHYILCRYVYPHDMHVPTNKLSDLSRWPQVVGPIPLIRCRKACNSMRVLFGIADETICKVAMHCSAVPLCSSTLVCPWPRRFSWIRDIAFGKMFLWQSY